MLYAPNYNSNNCAYIYNSDTIRVYDSRPTSPGNYSYTDYYPNLHYQFNRGSSTFSSYSTYPTCSDSVTTNFYYRTDILEILIIFTLIVGWSWFLISKLVKTLLKGGRIY